MILKQFVSSSDLDILSEDHANAGYNRNDIILIAKKLTRLMWPIENLKNKLVLLQIRRCFDSDSQIQKKKAKTMNSGIGSPSHPELPDRRTARVSPSFKAATSCSRSTREFQLRALLWRHSLEDSQVAQTTESDFDVAAFLCLNFILTWLFKFFSAKRKTLFSNKLFLPVNVVKLQSVLCLTIKSRK